MYDVYIYIIIKYTLQYEWWPVKYVLYILYI